MPRLTTARAATIAALLAAVALGTALRLVPWWRGADPDLVSDPAFHLRMTRSVSERWRLPAVDSLASAPAGREVERWLPTGLYWAAGAFHRVAAAIDGRDLETHARVFVALAGALIALPVYGTTRALHRGRAPALVAALVAVTLPAHLHRSFSYWFRYEALGTLLIATHVAFSLAALAAPARRAARAAALGAAVALVASLAVWRVAFMLPILEIAFVLLYGLLRPPGVALREWFGVQILGGTLACLGLAYLREQSFALSTAWLLALGLAAALWTPWLRREDAPPAGRFATLALAVLAAGWMGRLLDRERQYAQVLDAAVHKLAADLGITFATLPPVTRLVLDVDELQGSSAAALFGPGEMSWLGVAFVAAPCVWIAARWRRGPILERFGPAPALLAWLAAALTAVTLLFSRNKIVLAPLVAVVIGGLIAALAPGAAPAPASAPGAGRGRRSAGRAKPGAGRAARGLALALLVVCFVVTARDALNLAVTRESRMDPGLRAALAHLERETPPGAVVLAPWQHGYEIQTYARRRTLVDGLLEDPLTRSRLIEIARAWLAPRTDSLAAMCGRAGAGYLLVPPSTTLYDIAMLTDWPAAWKTRAGVPLNRQEADRVLVRMMVLGESPPPFERVFEAGQWRVYRRLE